MGESFRISLTDLQLSVAELLVLVPGNSWAQINLKRRNYLHTGANNSNFPVHKT